MKRIIIAILMVLILSNIAYAAKPNIGADQLRLDSGLVDTDGSLKVYSKSEVNATIENAILTKANTADVYTKTEVDNKSTLIYVDNMASGNYTGEVIIDAVAASLAQYSAVYLSSSGFNLAKGDAAATLPAIGIILETGTGNKKVLTKGVIKNAAWSFTKGDLIYISNATAGALTATKPTTVGNRINIIGTALDTNVIFVNPSTTFIEVGE
jgi:hypothetical protein